MLLKRGLDARMDQALPSLSSASDQLQPDSEELQHRVDFFRKLGYSLAEVNAALGKLGISTDTNSMLGELVRNRTSAAPCIPSSDGDEKGIQRDLLLSPSWALRVSPQHVDKNSADTELRPVVIDGSNVAMSHGNKEVFSCRGIQLAVNFFLDRGHRSVTVFVPTWRKEQPRPDAPITDKQILMELEKQKIVVFTPSRRVGGKRVVCYDDRFIVKLAYESDGVIVSNDTYRDLQGERPEWKKCIEERLLMYSFVNDKFMPPDDPLGRHGPSLDNFLRKKPLPTEQKRQLCPYDKKCTYGIKCKFYHPERLNQSYLSLADELREKAQIASLKEDRNSRQLQSNSGPVHNTTPYPQDSNAEYITDHKPPLCPAENSPKYWNDPRNSTGHTISCPASGEQSQPGLPSLPNHYYTYTHHEYFDSGLGSCESQYSDVPHCHSNSQRLIPQLHALLAGPRHVSAHLENNNCSQSCRCCSHVMPSSAQRRPQRHRDPEGQIKSETLPPHMFSSHQRSLPSHLQYSGPLDHHQHYWSDPCQVLLQPSNNSNSLPTLGHSSHPGKFPSSWSQQQLFPDTFDPQRVELRKKLYAIFNPHQVDTVMEMFPHLTDAEKLAAEIFNLKTQRGIFW